MLSMTKRKIAITISEEHLADARQAVAEGRARSVSAYIDEALAMRGQPRGLEQYIAYLKERYGEPSTEEHAWADAQLRAAARKLEQRRKA